MTFSFTLLVAGLLIAGSLLFTLLLDLSYRRDIECLSQHSGYHKIIGHWSYTTEGVYGGTISSSAGDNVLCLKCHRQFQAQWDDYYKTRNALGFSCKQ